MKKYIIITDSCSDLEKEFRDKYNIRYAHNTYSVNGSVSDANLDWEDRSPKEFYEIMRSGNRVATSQVNVNEYRKVFSRAIKEGYDILSLSVSTRLSSSYNISLQVAKELLESNPDTKIICIDTKNACLGLALLCIRAAELQEEGKTIEEVAKWIEDNKQTVHQEATVEKLVYLKQAGRVSATSAFFGGLLNVKPIIISDVNGANVAVEKVKGRKASFIRIAERIKEKIVDVPYQRILLGHADCLDDALELKRIIQETISQKLDIRISYIGQIIGASTGPGTLGVYFYGTEETYDSDKK